MNTESFASQWCTIGWICALPAELTAARLVLDVEHRDVHYKAEPNDNNTYCFGSIGPHHIVIAVLSMGEYGNNNAATAARDMIRSFRSVRVAVMVGVGGGAPLMEPGELKPQDVRLGDVVVSIPGHGRGGVCQYDFGKAVQQRSFQVTGHLNQPPTSLLAAVPKLESDAEIEGGYNLDDELSAILEKRPKLRKTLQRPPADSDRLFASSFNHPNEHQSCSEVCQDTQHVVKRAERGEDEDVVQVHYGLIASGNTLMKDALLRDRWARELGILCFEMEAAGLMNQFPFLVIRGICDYADSHKNKQWQSYAAMTAALYARRLLQALAPSKVEAEDRLSELKEIKQEMRQGFEKINSIGAQVSEQRLNARQTTMQAWLAAPDPSTNHNNAVKLRLPNSTSGRWIFATPAFRTWQRQEFPLLWLHGIPGCGKTVLLSTIIEQLRTHKTSEYLVLYFYFDTQDSRKQRLEQVLRSLILQVCSAELTTWNQLDSLYRSCQEGLSQPSEAALTDCLKEMCKERHIVIALDALDECPIEDKAREVIMDWIKTMIALDHTQIVTTSRLEHDIETALTRLTSVRGKMEIGGESVKADIHAFLYSHIYSDRGQLVRWKNSPDVQAKIKKSIVDKADGMFRWVVCQLDALGECMDLATLETALQELPVGLYPTYDRILQRIPRGHQAHALRILQFLAYAERPLRQEELVDVLAVFPRREPAFDERYRMPDSREIAVYCRSLTRVVLRKSWNRTTVELQLAHASVKDYLLLYRQENPFTAGLQESWAKACIVQVSLAYIFAAWEGRKSHVEDADFPFKRFAARYWMEYASCAAAASEDSSALIWRMLTTKSVFEYSLDSYDPDNPFPYPRLEGKRHALYYASMHGILESIKRLLDANADVNAGGGRYGNALQAACAGGHKKAVQLLLDKGADVNAGGGLYGNALQAACVGGHERVVQLLLNKGADVNAQGGMYGNALQAACPGGHERVVQLLLAKDADINAKGEEYGNALQAACARGHKKMVQQLLDKGAEIDAQSGEYSNALQAACSRGHEEVVQLLLSKGIHINAQGGQYGNALQAACAGGHKTIVQLLLNKDVDVNAQGGRYGNALQAACVGGYEKMAQLLLSKGADINAQGERYGDALQAACVGGHKKVVQLLLNKGADVNTRGGYYGNALQAVCAKGHKKVAQQLLDKGVDVNTQSGDHGSALQIACVGGHEKVMQQLLDKGADVNAQCANYGDDDALYTAADKGHEEVVQLPVNRGAVCEVTSGK